MKHTLHPLQDGKENHKQVAQLTLPALIDAAKFRGAAIIARAAALIPALAILDACGNQVGGWVVGLSRDVGVQSHINGRDVFSNGVWDRPASRSPHPLNVHVIACLWDP